VRRRWLHRVARLLVWVVGITVIVLAVLMALVQLSLPLLAQRPAWVAAQLSQRLQRPVSFAAMEGHWQPAGPLFVLRDIVVQPTEGGDALRIPQAELRLDLGSMIFPSRHLLNLHVRGMQLNLSHDADGSWHVNGFGVANGANNQNASLDRLSVDLWLSDSRLDINDAGKDYLLVADQLRLSRQGDHIRVGGSLHRQGATGTLRGAGSFRQDGHDGRLWLAGSAIDLPGLSASIDMGGYTAESGHGDLAMWLDWRDGKVVRGVVRTDLQDLSIANPDGNRARIAGLHGLAELKLGSGHDQGRDELRWAGDDGGALVGIVQQPGTDHVRLDLAARDLALEPLLPWLALKPQMSAGLARWLGEGHPRGSLSHVNLHWNRTTGIEAAEIAFKGLGIDALDKLPGVDHLDGVLRGDDRAYALELPAQAATLNFPAAFHQPFVMSKLAGDVALWHDDEAWHIGTDGFAFEGAGFGGEARGEVALPDDGSRPFLDLYAAMNHADVTAARLFWPSNMPPPAVDWLNHALVAGKLDSADVLVRGSLADWPFRHNEGRFEAHAEISGLTLDYGKDWPRAEGVHATADFVDNGMLVQADVGQSLGIKLTRAVALIPDFADTTLDLNVHGAGKGADAMEFVRKSPIASRQADVLGKLALGGDAAFDFHLSLPVRDVSHLVLDGTAQLKDSFLHAPEWKLALEQLEGPLHFDAHGMQAGPLKTIVHGQPATLQLAVAAANSDPATVLSAQLGGSFSIAELVQDYPTLKWLGNTAHGRSDFNIGFVIAHASGTADAAGNPPLAQTLSVDSQLQGMTLDLPAPLKKPAEDSLPLHLSLDLPINGSDVQIALGQLARARLRLPASDTQPLAASVMLGSAMPDTLPVKGIRVRGHAALLDVTGWVQQTAGGSGGGSDGTSLESIDVNADQALLFDHAFPAMHLQATTQADGLELDVDSAAVAGHFSVPAQELRKRGITARLQRLYWPKDTPPPSKKGKSAVAPATAATAAIATTPPVNPAATGITPSALPPFHMTVSDLRLGQAKLGDARLETWPTAQGMHLDQLRTLSRSVQINASGDWNGSAEDSHTHLQVDFSAENLGAMLTAFGFDGLFEGGKTHAVLNASWPGAPSSIDWANMDGTLGAKVSNGRILDVAPGVGRLFGLVSLAELPRRLTLDFGDVFGKGLGFDSITGDFRLTDGNATTNNLKIHGPAAEISVTGRTGLRVKDYDQQMIVVPHIGNSLPIVGAVVAGPVGIAAGLAVQGLLGHGLNKAAGARYRITGSWDKPVMTLVEKHAVVAPAPADTAPAPATSR